MKLTKHIKRNIVYRHIFTQIYHQDSNATLVIIGRPGKGKSTLGLKIASDLDPTFNVNRVCYDIKQLMELIKNGDPSTGELKPGQAIILDEVVNEAGAYSRTSLSKHNMVMAYISANFRAKRLILIFCLPKLTQLDRDVREVGVTGVFSVDRIDWKKKKSYAKFYFTNLNAFQGNSWLTKPRIVKDRSSAKITAIWFAKPPAELERLYKIKKMDYIREKENKWFEMLNEEKAKQEKVEKSKVTTMLRQVIDNKHKFMDNQGKINIEKIMLHFDIGQTKATGIARLYKATMNLE